MVDYSEKGIGDHLLANCCNHIVPCAEMTLCLILDLGDLGGKICRQKIWASPLQRQQHYLCFGFLELGIPFFLVVAGGGGGLLSISFNNQFVVT